MSDLSSLAGGFVRTAQRRPDATALVWAGAEISYAQLHHMVVGQQRRLAAGELEPGEPVGLLVDKSPAAIAMVLACVLSSRPFLLPSTELADLTLRMLFAAAGCRHVLDPVQTSIVDSPAVDDSLVRARQELAGVSFMLTTSGSTGLPKIVPLEQDAVDRFAGWASTTFGIGPTSTVLNVAPLNFDLCLLEVWTTLANGGRVVLVDPGKAANGRYLLELAASHRVNLVQAVPMFLGLMLDAAARNGTRLDSVEHVLVTGDVLPDQTRAGLPGLFPAARLYNVYGCTETNDSFVHELDLSNSDGPLPIGQPLPGVDAVLLDADGAVVPGPGGGELCVSTPFQTRGYLDPTGRYAEKFIQDPTGRSARRYFRTGDLARRDHHGSMVLLGRADFQVKVRGTAINTAEVEQVLLTHPGVLEAAVLAVPDPVAGKRLLCTVRVVAAAAPGGLALREHCARLLPRAAIPSVLRTVEEPLPKTTTGKIDRKAANDRHAVPRQERAAS